MQRTTLLQVALLAVPAGLGACTNESASRPARPRAARADAAARAPATPPPEATPPGPPQVPLAINLTPPAETARQSVRGAVAAWHGTPMRAGDPAWQQLLAGLPTSAQAAGGGAPSLVVMRVPLDVEAGTGGRRQLTFRENVFVLKDERMLAIGPQQVGFLSPARGFLALPAGTLPWQAVSAAAPARTPAEARQCVQLAERGECLPPCRPQVNRARLATWSAAVPGPARRDLMADLVFVFRPQPVRAFDYCGNTPVLPVADLHAYRLATETATVLDWQYLAP